MPTPSDPPSQAVSETPIGASPGRVPERPLTDANRLGLDYLALADAMPGEGDAALGGPIYDAHTHINSPACARALLAVADRFAVRKVWTMTGRPFVERMRRELTTAELDRIEFICVPDFAQREVPGTFTTAWLDDIRWFRSIGCRVVKYWCGPRGLDMDDSPGSPFRLGSPIRREGMRLAHELGYRVFMVHVADPDTWFETMYADASKYGTKAAQYEPLEELLAEYRDVTWIAAHTAGSPEDLDFVQGLLDRHPNLVIDISACKWQVRELSKRREAFVELCRANHGRVLFGTDVVAWDENNLAVADLETGKPSGEELYASRYWAYRTLLESDYDGPSPIVDPDFAMLDPSADPKQTARLRGTALDAAELHWLYRGAVERVFAPMGGAGVTPTTPVVS